MCGDAKIRYHFPNKIELDAGERVVLEELLPGTSEFVERAVAPDNVRDMESIPAWVRSIALARGGEAWRAVTERGEILCAYSVGDLAKELGANPVITMHPRDQFYLLIARLLLGISIGWGRPAIQ